MSERRKVLMVGLGTIARTHHEVLAADQAVEIVGGVDPNPRFDAVAPVFQSVQEALAAGIEPDLVVVATPTETHVEIVSDLLDRCDAQVLSEKPLAADTSAVARLVRTHGCDLVASRVKVSHHFAFSPEVEWARQVVEQNPAWGPPTRIMCVYNDAYAALPAPQLAGYVSSWVDSGPNQLSVAAAFSTGWKVRSHASRTERSVTVLAHDGGETILSSNWLAADTSKQTAVRFDHVDVEVRIDHTSMTALVTKEGQVIEHVGYAGSAGRKAAHYIGVYRTLFSDPSDRRLSVELATDIAEVLEAGAQMSGPVDLSWSAITESD